MRKEVLSFSQVKMAWLGVEMPSIEIEVDGDREEVIVWQRE